MAKKFLLGKGIRSKRAMPIDMIRSDVEQDTDVGAKFSGQIKLEAGKLKHRAIVNLRRNEKIKQRRSDIAADKWMFSRGLQQRPYETCHRCLAV